MKIFQPVFLLPALLALGALDSSYPLAAQTYAPPASGDYGSNGPAAVTVETFANPIYPTANNRTLTVSIYHPNAAIDPSLPTIFFAHGYPPQGLGVAADYSALLNNLASRGYNVIFSPYEGDSSPSNAKRFDELTTGWEAAVALHGLNTAQVGFVGHSFGAGLLPALIQHETMGLASAYRAGNRWGSAAAFMFSMAPALAFDGGGQTGVGGSQTIAVPANLNVIEQVYFDDKAIADPRLAIDIFYNLSTPASQKNFLTVYGDSHGSPAQVANHFLPNTIPGQTSASLQAWAILRHLDALAACTFTGDATARALALGGGVAAETNEGTWSDGVPVKPLGAAVHPAASLYAAGPYLADWSGPANPRRNFPLLSGSAFFTGEIPLSDGVSYLPIPGSSPFGYYSYLSDFHYIYHFDLGYEYWFDAADGVNGVYFYDFTSASFFYTSPSFPFPYLYDFTLNAVLYYYPVAGSPDRYTTSPRYFYNFVTGMVITK